MCLITCPNLETTVCPNFLSGAHFLTGVSDLSDTDFPKTFDQCHMLGAAVIDHVREALGGTGEPSPGAVV